MTTLEKVKLSERLWNQQHFSRIEVQEILTGMPAGTFIIRGSSQSNSVALSMIGPTGLVDHFLIVRKANGLYGLKNSENLFGSIQDLLAHYADNFSVGIPCKLLILYSFKSWTEARLSLKNEPLLNVNHGNEYDTITRRRSNTIATATTPLSRPEKPSSGPRPIPNGGMWANSTPLPSSTPTPRPRLSHGSPGGQAFGAAPAATVDPVMPYHRLSSSLAGSGHDDVRLKEPELQPRRGSMSSFGDSRHHAVVGPPGHFTSHTTAGQNSLPGPNLTSLPVAQPRNTPADMECEDVYEDMGSGLLAHSAAAVSSTTPSRPIPTPRSTKPPPQMKIVFVDEPEDEYMEMVRPRN